MQGSIKINLAAGGGYRVGQGRVPRQASTECIQFAPEPVSSSIELGSIPWTIVRGCQCGQLSRSRSRSAWLLLQCRFNKPGADWRTRRPRPRPRGMSEDMSNNIYVDHLPSRSSLGYRRYQAFSPKPEPSASAACECACEYECECEYSCMVVVAFA